MVNSPDCCTSLFSSHLILALTLSANSESLPIMSPMQSTIITSRFGFTAYGRICTAMAPIQTIQLIQ